MTSTNKPERDWHDPPSLEVIEGLNPSVMEHQVSEGDFNPKSIPKWYRLFIVGVTYLFTGVVIEIGLFLNLPVDSLPVALIICGVILIGYGYYSRRKNIELRIGE